MKNRVTVEKEAAVEKSSRHYPPGHRPPSAQEGQRLEIEAPAQEAPHAQDYWRVNLAEPWEVAFWTREFGCSEHDLKSAVEAVGKSAGAVRAYLRNEPTQPKN